METATIENEIKQIKTQILDAIKAKADLETVQQMQRQLDALDVSIAERVRSGGVQRTLKTILEESDSVARLLRDKRGSAVITLEGKDAVLVLGRKDAITSSAVGLATSGVLMFDRIPDIVEEARQRLVLRDMFRATPTAMQVVDFVRVKTALATASPQVEASSKFQNKVEFESASEKIQTIATWIPATRQVLDDMGELMNFLQTGLTFYVNQAEELQMLFGDGNGVNLDGLATQAADFNYGLLPLTGYTRLDVVGAAIQQVNEAKEVDPTFAILHPRDWWLLRRTKDTLGRYILGDPNSPDSRRIWDLTVVPTCNMSVGNFLVGSGDPAAAEIRDRMGVTVEISTQHEDYFTRNLVAIRCEKRTALITKRPNSFVYGALASSPA